MAASVGERIVEGGEQSEVTELWTFMQRAWRQLTAPCYPADLIPSHTGLKPGVPQIGALSPFDREDFVSLAPPGAVISEPFFD